MNEAAVVSEISNLMHRLYLWPIKGRDAVACPKCGTITYPVADRPDLVCLRANVVIEVKMMNGSDWEHQSFAFDKITPGQRTWLAMWLWDEPRPAQAFLALGTRHGTAGTVTRPRLLWVVPWEEWLKVEAQLLPYRKSLPIASFSGQKPKEVQEQALNAIRLLKHWALEWKDGKWHLPEPNPPHTHWLAHYCPREYWDDGERDTTKFAQKWDETRRILNGH